MAPSVRQPIRAKANRTTEDASEDELQEFDIEKGTSPNSAADNIAPPTRKAGRPKKASNDVVTAKTVAEKGVHISPRAVRDPKKAVPGRKAVGKRAVLTDISNIHNASDTEEVDEFDLPQSEVKASGTLPTPMTATKTRGRKAKAPHDVEEPVKPVGRRARTKRTPVITEVNDIPETQPEVLEAPEPARKKTSAAKTKRDVIPDTQSEPMTLNTLEDHEMKDIETRDATPRAKTMHQEILRSSSRAPHQPSVRSREMSASAERKGPDSLLRRQLDDMTSRFDSLEVKYKTLKDIAVREAEMNFDKLKKLADERTKGLSMSGPHQIIYQYTNTSTTVAANELISSLQSDIGAQGVLVTELASVRKEQINVVRQNEKMALEKKHLDSSLHEAQNEIKALQAKLSASRASSTAIKSSETAPKVPGSAVKPSHGMTRTLLVGSAEAAKEAQKRILKEELYGDLTGLILRDVKRKEEEGEDVYDCIQTGRNGSKFFKAQIV